MIMANTTRARTTDVLSRPMAVTGTGGSCLAGALRHQLKLRWATDTLLLTLTRLMTNAAATKDSRP